MSFAVRNRLGYSSTVMAAAALLAIFTGSPAFGQTTPKPTEPAKTPTAGKADAKRARTVKSDRPAHMPVGQAPSGEAKKGGQPAATAKPDLVVANPQRDPDFAFLGEFVGPLAVSPTQYERWGLQIRPIGEGGFEAIQYRGGLPGEVAFQPKPITLVGKRFETFLVLSGGPWAVLVEPDHCLLLDRQGRSAGRLERIVRRSPTLGAAAPKDSLVLFDGKGTAQFTKGQMTTTGLLMEGAEMRPMLQDFNLHVEFQLPYMPAAKDQARANSGIYMQSRYEVQMLDSFATEPVFNGCGALYRQRKPDLNMCLPPLAWQTYDIAFTAPRWAADETKLKNARVTIWLNGVKIHSDVEITGPTGAGKIEEPTLLPTFLQDHHNPVRYRNVWIVDRGAAPAANFPVLSKPADALVKPAVKRPARPVDAPVKPKKKPANV